MTSLKLIQSGGIAGKTLSCETSVSIPAEKIISALKNAAPERNPHLRDAINFSLIVNDESFEFEISKLDRDMQLVVEKMMDGLKP